MYRFWGPCAVKVYRPRSWISVSPPTTTLLTPPPHSSPPPWKKGKDSKFKFDQKTVNEEPVFNSTDLFNHIFIYYLPFEGTERCSSFFVFSDFFLTPPSVSDVSSNSWPELPAVRGLEEPKMLAIQPVRLEEADEPPSVILHVAPSSFTPFANAG